MHCPHCHQRFPVDDAFCPHDGTPLVPLVRQAPPPVPGPGGPSQAIPRTPSRVDRSAGTVRLPSSSDLPLLSAGAVWTKEPSPRDAMDVSGFRIPRADAGWDLPGPGQPATDALAPGRIPVGTWIGDYRITGEIGHGGMTTVYGGEHPVIGKRVAIKVLHAQHAGDPELLDRFIQEARAVNQVGSERIVDIFGLGHLPDGRAYLVMDRVDGQPLDELLHHGGPLASTQAHSIFTDAAQALAAAHGVGIVHRDVKPSNLMVRLNETGSFRAKVLDFGVAKLVGPADHGPAVHTAAGFMIGTPGYMAPEQIRGQPVDARSDIYAFGVTLFEALTGELPFPRDPDVDILIQHLRHAPRVPSTLRPGLSAEWDRLVTRCLEKNPEHRPQTMAEVLAALARLGAQASRGGTGYLTLPAWSGAAGVTAEALSVPDAMVPAEPAPHDTLITGSRPRIWPWVLACAAGVTAVAAGVVLLLG